MQLSWIDLAVIVLYLIGTLFVGFWLSKRASKNLESYFLGGNSIKWYFLGLSNASGMFDISGVMWSVTICFIYGLKSAWIPWLWPVWNQIFVMVFLAIWMRRSGVMTGAQWITFRFGDEQGGKLSHIIVVIFALISVVGFIAYFFEGIGKFAAIFFQWDLSMSFLGIEISSPQTYALVIIAITTIYTLKGGFYSVVATEIFQFVIMTISCIVVAVIAYRLITPVQVQEAVPDNWGNLFFGWQLELDWSDKIPALNDKIATDGFGLFGPLIMLMLFKGIFSSLAGPVPSYDMQRILSTKNPSEAAKMSGLTPLVLFFPRYLMIAGFAVLALVFLRPEIIAQGSNMDFETVLPLAIKRFIPIGFQGLLLAGLLAAFMGTFAAFINAAPVYLVNDLYKKYINPKASDKKLVSYSYLSSIALVLIGIVFGFFAGSLNSLTLWITASLYGGYAAANVLKWIWWRFNGYGYFFGMLGGLIGSTVLPPSIRLWFPGVIDIYIFPAILVMSIAFCIVGTYLTKPENMETLKKFYRQTRPWGFWKPVYEELVREDPKFRRNNEFKQNMVNVVVGIIWQMTMVIMPMYLLIKDHQSFFIGLFIFVVSSIFLKMNWYNRLKHVK
ncbi:sodium:solute symporter family protein [Fulvivirgaceae bacterium BMA10]|uniref:Sodium:solute symporter family protein n=1 Tax=Splendidivirga corallicola TaxID=3051826 RepID=A0ABT8KGK5_9BACT|nr:sodium:solute symporter family protein [Fulvivirgaceae bacterium BMA10]